MTFGRRRSPPIVTYGGTPRGSPGEVPSGNEHSRNLALNIAGIVTPVAAITLGIIAFTAGSDFRSAQPGEGNAGDRDIVPRPDRVPVRENGEKSVVVSPGQVPLATKGQRDNLITPIPAPVASHGHLDAATAKSWTPATVSTAPTQIVARAAERTTPAISAIETEVIAAPTPEMPASLEHVNAFGNAAALKAGLGTNDTASLATHYVSGGVRIEFTMAALPEGAERSQAGKEYVRRDYSRTIASPTIPRDISIARTDTSFAQSEPRLFEHEFIQAGQIRERMERLRNAHPRLASPKNDRPQQQDSTASSPQQAFAGIIAPENIIHGDSWVTWVKLGALLDIVGPEIAPDHFASLAGSSSADAFVSPATLHSAGIDLDYNGGTGEVVLSAAG